MPRETYVYREGLGVIPAHEAPPLELATARNFGVIGDIKPYLSLATGEHVGGRRQHRDMLRAHGLVEVGNEKNYRGTGKPEFRSDGLKQDIKRAMQERGF